MREKGPDDERPALSFGSCPFRIRFASGARLPQGRHLSRAMRMTSTASATTMNTQVMENPPRHSLATCLHRTVLHVTAGKPYLWRHRTGHSRQTHLHALRHIFIKTSTCALRAFQIRRKPRTTDAPPNVTEHTSSEHVLPGGFDSIRPHIRCDVQYAWRGHVHGAWSQVSPPFAGNPGGSRARATKGTTGTDAKAPARQPRGAMGPQEVSGGDRRGEGAAMTWVAGRQGLPGDSDDRGDRGG